MTELAKSRAQPDEQIADSHDVQPRPLSPLRRAQVPLISGAAYAFARITGPTLRYEVLGWQHIERVHRQNRRCVYSFWHQTIFLAMWWWRHRGVVAMTSANFDGQILGNALKKLGFDVTFGSSSHGGLRGISVLAGRLEQGHGVLWQDPEEVDCPTHTVPAPHPPTLRAGPSLSPLTGRGAGGGADTGVSTWSKSNDDPGP